MEESKNIIDTYLNQDHNIDNVDSLQVCRLDLVISNLSLSAPGIYVANDAFFGPITRSLEKTEKILKIALNLLLFKSLLISIKNQYQDTKLNYKQKTIKGPKYAQSTQKINLQADKQDWIRGTWVTNRDSKSKLPPLPTNLTR